MAVYKVLEEIMGEMNISIADVARICNLPDSTVRGIIRRKQENIALDVAFRLSDGLDVSLEKLNGLPERVCSMPKKETAPPYSEEALKLAEDYDGLDGHGKRIVRLVADEEKARCEADQQAKAATLQESREQMEVAGEIAPEVYFIVPGFTSSMSAGTGQIAGDEYPENYRLVKEPPRGTSYIAPIDGNSMEPTYQDGDKLFIHACTNIRQGQIGVFFMDGKQWVKELGNGVLISHNEAYEPRQMTEDIVCQGLVLGVCDESYFE